MDDGGVSFPDWLMTLTSNPVFAGIAGGAGFSAVLYQARAVPKLLFDSLKRQLSVTLVIDNSDELFSRLAIHLSRSPDVQRARWLRMVELYDDVEQRWCWRASFGEGWHLIRDEGNWFLIHRNAEEKAAGLTLTRRETMTIRCFGRSQASIRALMERAEDVYNKGDTIRVNMFHSGTYLLADRRPLRSLDTVFIPEEQKRRLFQDLDRFVATRAIYRNRGTPYRRGYLFKGPPGTGKTTLAFAMASYLRRPVYLVNLNTCGGDTGLQAAFNQAEAGAVVVIEDIDTAKITHDRAKITSAEVKIEDKPADAVTLAGLLNVIDGLASRENRILVITSNHADTLDPALLRPGRIDRTELIDYIGEVEALAMTCAFLGSEPWVYRWFEREVAAQLPISPAELQGKLLVAADEIPTLRLVA